MAQVKKANGISLNKRQRKTKSITTPQMLLHQLSKHRCFFFVLYKASNLFRPRTQREVGRVKAAAEAAHSDRTSEICQSQVPTLFAVWWYPDADNRLKEFQGLDFSVKLFRNSRAFLGLQNVIFWQKCQTVVLDQTALFREKWTICTISWINKP